MPDSQQILPWREQNDGTLRFSVHGSALHCFGALAKSPNEAWFAARTGQVCRSFRKRNKPSHPWRVYRAFTLKRDAAFDEQQPLTPSPRPQLANQQVAIIITATLFCDAPLDRYRRAIPHF